MQPFYLVALASLAVALPNSLVTRALQACGNNNNIQCCGGVARREPEPYHVNFRPNHGSFRSGRYGSFFNNLAGITGLGATGSSSSSSNTGTSASIADCALSIGQICGVSNVYCCAGSQTGLINLGVSCNSVDLGVAARSAGVITLPQ